MIKIHDKITEEVLMFDITFFMKSLENKLNRIGFKIL